MTQRALVLGITCGLLPVLACAHNSEPIRFAADEPISPARQATVITREQLAASSGGPLLDAILKSAPQVRSEQSTGCPRIALRRPIHSDGTADPDIYVDGARTADTCVLTSLSANDVERVEIYPTGVTPRSGYATAAYGLILVFLRRR